MIRGKLIYFPQAYPYMTGATYIEILIFQTANLIENKFWSPALIKSYNNKNKNNYISSTLNIFYLLIKIIATLYKTDLEKSTFYAKFR